MSFALSTNLHSGFAVSGTWPYAATIGSWIDRCASMTPRRQDLTFAGPLASPSNPPDGTEAAVMYGNDLVHVFSRGGAGLQGRLMEFAMTLPPAF